MNVRAAFGEDAFVYLGMIRDSERNELSFRYVMAFFSIPLTMRVHPRLRYGIFLNALQHFEDGHAD